MIPSAFVRLRDSKFTYANRLQDKSNHEVHAASFFRGEK